MRGSLAVWYEQRKDGVSGSGPPRVELHFNIWRDLSSSANILDVGFILENAQSLCRFFLFIPTQIELAKISDLSQLLMHGGSLNAVFNDIIKIGDRGELSFTTAINQKPFLRIHHLQEQDLSIETVNISGDRLGTVIKFGVALCNRVVNTASEKNYIRIRLILDERAAELFSSETQARDWWLLSSFARTELAEFRLNERRSLPPEIAEWADKGRLQIKRIHYFLVRDFRYELVMQHPPFRKVRRLEGDLWREYLRGRLPGNKTGTDLLPEEAADRMLIYHWRQPERPNELSDNEAGEYVEDFIAFATFRWSKSNIVLYAIIIALVGALGNAIEPVIGWGLSAVLPPMREAPLHGVTLATLIILTTVVFGIAKWLERRRRNS
jgi:hypothetical protein